MILRSRFFIYIILSLISFNSSSQKIKPSISLNGYVKYLPAHMNYSFFESENNHLIHNRLNFKGYLGSNLSMGIEIRNRVFFGDVPTIQGDNGLIDMSYFIIREDKVAFNS